MVVQYEMQVGYEMGVGICNNTHKRGGRREGQQRRKAKRASAINFCDMTLDTGGVDCVIITSVGHLSQMPLSLSDFGHHIVVITFHVMTKRYESDESNDLKKS